MAGRGHHGASHHGKHHVSHHGSEHVEHHHYKKGGGIPEEHGGKRLDYTAESNVVPEAEGERRKRGGRMNKADGGAVALRHGGAVHHGKHHVSHHGTEHAEHHHHADGGAVALADGGAVGLKRGGRAKKHVDGEGHKGHRRMDRPGRKRGGGVGSDMTPLTTAARTREAGAHKADNDELEE
jgi:hypothetical protein